MAILENDKLQRFEDQSIRTAWDEESEEWYFSVVDVVNALTEQKTPRGASNYWAKLKQRLKAEGANELLTNCQQLKMKASDGKRRLTDVATTEQLLRIIQSIPSKKAEPFKLWLAQVGRERIEEIIDPELTIERALDIVSVANIPEIMVQSELINKILHTDYLENAGINEFEHIRENLRDLIKYIQPNRMTYTTNFSDEILTMDWNESELENDDLKNYKMKAEFYVRQNQDNAVIAKLKSNKPLTGEDIKVLEGILWSELGSKQDYESEYGSKPLGEFVREIVGLDMNAAKEAFAEFLNDTSLDSRQIYFVNQIVEYIVHNGLLKDLSVLQDAPFTDNGSIVEVFTDLTVWLGIKTVIDQINANAVAA